MSDSWDDEIKDIAADLDCSGWGLDDLTFTRVTVDALGSAIQQKWLEPDGGAPSLDDVISDLAEKFVAEITDDICEAAADLVEGITKADYWASDNKLPDGLEEKMFGNCKKVCDAVLKLLE